VATATSSIEECFLCDAPVDVKFEPCGHAILCSECAERARKCLKCKVYMYMCVCKLHLAAINPSTQRQPSFNSLSLSKHTNYCLFHRLQ
jgi:hypothetical protein